MNNNIDWGNLHDKVNRPEITKEKVKEAIINAANCDGDLKSPIISFGFENDELVSIGTSEDYNFETVCAFGVVTSQNIFNLFFENLRYWMVTEFIKVNPQYADSNNEPVNIFFYNYLDNIAADIIRDNFLILDRWFTFEEWADILFNGAEYHDCRQNDATIAYRK